MNTNAIHRMHPDLSILGHLAKLRLALGAVCLALAGCGGSADAPPPPETATPLPPAAIAPTITQQPANLSVIAGQPAAFSVAATGTAPLSYQWQRNGAVIAGATSTSYSLSTTTLADTGALFTVVVTNMAGSATSNTATLSITLAAPVLTITPQPASISVVAGTSASFTVGGTCSSGTLNVQWQRRANTAGTFTNVPGATAATYSFLTASTDNGVQVQANLDCSGQSGASSNIATLIVNAPVGTTLSLYPLAGLRDQGRINGAMSVDQLADGSYAVFVNSRLQRLSADRLSITALAGGSGSGFADGAGAIAMFRTPLAITHDATGVIYVADLGNNAIRRVATDGTVSTLAGSPALNGNVDGTGAAAQFRSPQGIALGPDGDLYVADSGNNTIRRVTTAGVVTTYAGTGTGGYLDGAAASARFSGLSQLVAAANGDLIVADTHRIRRILRNGATAGSVETLAGTGVPVIPGTDGPGATATFTNPSSLVLQGNLLYFRDAAGLVRTLDLTTRVVSTFAGSRTLGSGYADGAIGVGRLDSQGGMTAGTGGGLVAADQHGLRSIDNAGSINTFAAANSYETDVGTGVLAQLPLQSGSLAVDSSGRIANFDNASRAVRRIDSTGTVTLIAGLTGGFDGVLDGTGSEAQFADAGVSIAAGSGNVLFVGDNYVLRRIGADNVVSTIAGSTTVFGGTNGTGAAATFNRLVGLAVGPTGDVFVADAGNNALRRVTPAGLVTTYAGLIGTSTHLDGPVASARLQSPVKLTFTPDGTLWFADGPPGAAALRRVSPDGSTVSSIAGSGLGIQALAADSNGIVYYMINADLVVSGGLFAYDPATGTSTRLISAGVDQQTRLGVGGSLPPIGWIAVLGPKRLLASGAANGQLLLVTLP